MKKIFTKEENIDWSKKIEGKMTSACLLILDGDKVLMVKANYKDEWTFPSGIVDSAESPLEAAIREAKEETGYEALKQDVRFFSVIHTKGKDGERDRFNFAFIVDREDVKGILNVPNKEIDYVDWVDEKKIAQMAGGRASYRCFERLLLEDVPDEIVPRFVEV